MSARADLGNPPPGRPVAALDADGNIEVFKVDADGEVRHRWRKTINGDWSNWATLGGTFDPGLSVIRDKDGMLEVLAVEHATHALKCSRQSRPNGPFWSGWSDLGGTVQAPVAAATGEGGDIEVFACGAGNGGVKYIHQLPGGTWSGWAELGGNVQPQLAAARDSDGRMEVFGIAPATGHLLHCWQLEPAPGSRWSVWADLGGKLVPEMAIGHNRDGRLEVFCVNPSDNAVDRICQTTAGDSAHWTKWINFYQAHVLPGLTVSTSGDERMEAFAVNAKDSTLWHCWQMRPDGSDTWSGWWGMGWPVQSVPSAVHDNDGNLELFAAEHNNSGALDYKRQISASSDWLDWERMDRTSFDYTTRTWQMDEGLPNNTVQAVTQTSDGFLWVGTQAGLARFDGTSFFCYDQRNTPALKNSSITALCADRDGALWIGTDGGGLLAFSNGVFTKWSASNGLACDALRVVYQTQDGAIWVGTTNGMSRYQQGRWTTYTTGDGLLSDWVQSIFEDRDHVLWIGTSRGLNRLKGGKMDSFLMPQGIPNDAVRAICQDKGGRTWIASNNGLLWYDWYFMGHFYAYNTRYGLSDSFVSALCEDRERNFWVGTFSGLNRFRDGRFYPQFTEDGLPFDRVNTLYEDREGDLWAGTKEGLVRLTPKRFAVYTREQGLSHNNVTSVSEDRDGNLWLGTWGGGVDELVGERVRALTTTNGLSDDLVLATCQTRDGSIWIGADFDGGLTRLKDGVLSHYGPAEGLISAGIRVLYEDRQGNLWIGTRRGLVCLSNGKFTTYTVKDNLAGNDVRVICEDRAGALWIGTETGLSRLANGQFVNFNSHNGLSDDVVLAVTQDRAGALWIGTQNGGLDRYRDGHFTNYRTQQGLFSDEIFSILEDDAGWFWMSCSKGVFRVRKDDFEALDHGLTDSLVCIAYGKSDGMESPQCNGLAQPAACKTQDGRLCFPTSKGLVVVNPRSMRVDQIAPPVVVEQVLADKEPVRAPGPLGSPFEKDTVLRLPPGRGELAFHFTALAYRMPERSQFKYKLEGVDPDWVDAGHQRVAYYNNIYPGSYRFEVMACNQDGIWSKNEASVSFVLAPHIWQTLWFRALAALAVVGGVSVLARYLAVRRIRRRLELLEQRHAVEKERNRIAKDIHDDLGSSLTRIMMLGERTEEGLVRREDVTPHIRKIVDSARDTVQSLDEIVWAVNPENDTLDGLATYISHYADEFFEETDISCRLEMPVKLPAAPLKAEVRHDLFLAVKEAFNNSLKHSGASAVRVRVSSEGNSVSITIDDNGRGFALNGNGNGNGRHGNGLLNMRRRIENIGGRFSITSAPNCGTQVSFSVILDAPPARLAR